MTPEQRNLVEATIDYLQGAMPLNSKALRACLAAADRATLSEEEQEYFATAAATLRGVLIDEDRNEIERARQCCRSIADALDAFTRSRSKGGE